MRRFLIYTSVMLLIFLLLPVKAKNVAIVLDATGSLNKYGVLDKYVENVKTIIEIITAVETNPDITVVKFGAVGESELIFSGRTSLNDKRTMINIFNLIDENLSPSELYKKRTSFYEGFSKIVSSDLSYDTTIFITDGLDNDKAKSLEDLINEYGRDLNRLGRIIFVFVPPTKAQLTDEAKGVISNWAKSLNAELLIATQRNFVEQVIKSFLKDKVQSYIFGYSYVLFKGSIELEKYADNSKLVLIFVPSISIYANSAHIYKGIKLSYVEIKGRAGLYKINFKEKKRGLVFYYETTNYIPKVIIEPRKDKYFRGESIKYSIEFVANEKKISNPFFENTLYIQLKLNNNELSPKRYIDSKVGSVSLDDPGKVGIYMRYSYFKDTLLKQNYRQIYSSYVRKETNLLSVYLEQDEIYEYQKFNLKIVPRGISIRKGSIIVELKDTKSGRKKLVTLFRKGAGSFVGKTALPVGVYEVKPTGKYIIGGVRVFEVKPRKLILRLYEFNSDTKKPELKSEDTYSTQDRELVASVDLKYALNRNEINSYELFLSLEPLFDKESLIVQYKKDISDELIFKGRKYLPVPVMFSYKTEGKILVSSRYNGVKGGSINYRIDIRRNKNVGIEEFVEPPIAKVALIENLGIEDEDGDVYRFGAYNVELQLNIVGKGIYLAKRWGVFLVYLMGLAVLIVLLIIWRLKQFHVFQKKVALLDKISKLHPEDFPDFIPSKVMFLLGGNPKLLQSINRDPELIKKIAKAWELKQLKVFYEQLIKPINVAKRKLKIGESIRIGFMPDKEKDIRLRDKSVDVELDISTEMFKSEILLRIKSYGGFFRINGSTYSDYKSKVSPNSVIEIEIEGYIITLEVEGNMYTVIVSRNLT